MQRSPWLSSSTALGEHPPKARTQRQALSFVMQSVNSAARGHRILEHRLDRYHLLELLEGSSVLTRHDAVSMTSLQQRGAIAPRFSTALKIVRYNCAYRSERTRKRT